MGSTLPIARRPRFRLAESHHSKCSGFDALYHADYRWPVSFRFLLAKWAGAFVMGLWVMLAALIAKRAAAGWIGALALPLAMYGIRAAIPATSSLERCKICEYGEPAADQ